MSEATEGSCNCGAVRYRVFGPFGRFQYCHCSRCRKETGSAHAAKLFVSADRFEWLAGEERVQRYDHPEAKYWSRGFCSTCGSPMPHETRGGGTMIIPGGSLDTDPGARPERSIYFGSRAPWYTPPGELEAFDELPED